MPDQDNIKKLIRNLNGWRRNAGKDYLIYGRMQKPIAVEGTRDIPMITKKSEREIHFPSVFTCNWSMPDGRMAQFLVNYLPEAQTVSLDISVMRNAELFDSPDRQAGIPLSSGKITIEPLSAIMIEYAPVGGTS